MHQVSRMVLWLALVLLGLNAGFFYTWSTTVMPGLDGASASSAVEAMQAVNANIRTPAFGVVFFGAPLVTLIAATLSFIGPSRRAGLLAAGGFVAAAGVVIITFSMHVPWNDALSHVSLPNLAAADVWAEYSAKWTAWNHVRSVLAVAAFVLLAMAFSKRTSPHE